MLITLESLVESDKKRNERRSVASSSADQTRGHKCHQLCSVLVADSAVQQAIRVIYAANSAYTIRDENANHDQAGDWQGLNFKSLLFHRHGTTSIILRVRDRQKRLRALKLILFPFLRFHAIARETREYGLRYNPNILSNGDSPSSAAVQAGKVSIDDLEFQQIDENSSGIVEVLASSERWILMKYIDGLTLAELMAYPGLINAKLELLDNEDSDNQTFSQILRSRLRSYSTEELREANVDVSSLEHMRLEALLREGRRVSSDFPGIKIKKKFWQRIPAKLKLTAHFHIKSRNPDNDDPDSVAWRWMFAIGSAIFTAMIDLSKLSAAGHGTIEVPRIHGDLTPSNIIVNNSKDLSVTLIDLGRNYFYTQSIAGRGSADSGFVAPEIREGGLPDLVSDVYSMGQLLQYVGYRGATPTEMVFDGYYDRTSLVARFLEDLIQEAKESRLAIFTSARSKDEAGNAIVDYEELKNIHNAEVTAVMAADHDGHGLVGDSTKEVIRDILHPWSRAIKRQWRLWQQRKNRQQQPTDKRLRGYIRWLFLWSTLATVSGALVLGCVILWWFRDLNLPFGPETLALSQKVTTGNSRAHTSSR